MNWNMAAIIDYNIDLTNSFDHVVKKLFVRLIADKYLDVLTLKPSTIFKDVDPYNFHIRFEETLPHLKRPTMLHPDLNYSWAFSSKFRQITVIYLEIIRVLLNRSLINFFKEI